MPGATSINITVMPLSPVSSKYIAFLLALLYLQVHTVEASVSTSADFPQDVFAKPAFQVRYGSIGKDAVTLPIKRTDAVNILQQQEHSSSSPSNTSSSSTSKHLARLFSSLESAGVQQRSSASLHPAHPPTFLWSLQRASPDHFQLCSIPDFTFTPADKHTSNRPRAAPLSSPRTKQDLIRNAQRLLEPLKSVCLYHTSEWFTYSFCHGREIRQFRRLGPQTAAQKAFKAAGGGDAGKKAALEAAEKVSSLQHPIDDPQYPAYTLGRWTSQSEEIVGDDPRRQPHQKQSLSDAVASTTGVSVSSGVPSLVNTAGLDLVEEVQFGDWDEEELFAAEARALAHFKQSQSSAIEAGHDATNNGVHDSRRHRYLTQRWTNGTLCDMNHQPRTVEVQFHCSNSKPLEDRIVMFKETTICNYVLVIETPRLCADPAFSSEKEDAPLPIHCHQVVEDNYPGPTLGDPDKVSQSPFSEIGDKANQDDAADMLDADSRRPTQDEKAARSEQEAATSSTEQGVEDAATTSHTYGDLSRYGSVHDDYFDEALGGHGALFQEYEQDNDHDHEHDHDHDHNAPFHQHNDDIAEAEAEVVVEIGFDENGQVLVNKVIESPAKFPPTPAEGKEFRRRENGKKRNDDDSSDDTKDRPVDIQLDIDDFLSVLRGGEGASLEKKLAEKISDLLSKEMQQQQQQRDSSPENAGAGKEQKPQTPDEMAKLYKRFMSAITGEKAGTKSSSEDGRGAMKDKAQGQGKQPPALRMEKVGDSLSERVKRFYEAKERESKAQSEKKKGGSTPPAHVAEHLEL